MKIMHYALFGVSGAVKNWMFDNGTDPDVVALSDYKFMKVILHMLPTLFNYRPNITIDQFFKYGYAETKMLLCTDTINLVKA